jgi:hypothetical protein
LAVEETSKKKVESEGKLALEEEERKIKEGKKFFFSGGVGEFGLFASLPKGSGHRLSA